MWQGKSSALKQNAKTKKAEHKMKLEMANSHMSTLLYCTRIKYRLCKIINVLMSGKFLF